MLKLLLPMLGNRWGMGEAATSDVVILDAETLEELNRAGTVRPDALYVVFEESTPPPANSFSAIRRPLNSSGLIEVLHRAQAELERRAGGGADARTVARGFEKCSPALGGIEAPMRTAVRWVLQSRSAAATILNPQRTPVLSLLPEVGFTTRLDSSDIAGLIRTNAPVAVLTLNDRQRAELFSQQRKYYPLKKLEWIYWLAGSNGELRPELDAETPYRLSRWPDFSRLPHYRADVHMASLLKVDALAVRELSERSGARMETAINFLNACWSLGLLAPSARREPTNPVASPEARSSPSEAEVDVASHGTMIGSLRSAFGLGARKSNRV